MPEYQTPIEEKGISRNSYTAGRIGGGITIRQSWGGKVAQMRRSGRGWIGTRWLPIAAVALVAVFVGVAMLAPWAGHPGTSGPAGSAGGTATTPTTAAPTIDPSRYSDGIPRTWQGQPVLRGGAALDAAAKSTDGTPFLIAFWAGSEGVVLGGADSGTVSCGSLSNVGDEPGVPSPELGRALEVHTAWVAPGPVIVRVHTHDPEVAPGCRQVMVGDAVLWNGDAATAPRPWSTAQVARAFGVAATPMADNCLGRRFPGVAILDIPSATTMFDGMVAVFPSVAALAAAAPDAARGETDVAPAAVAGLPCATWHGSPAHWLARGNVLVGLLRDPATQPDDDPAVISALAALARLT
jgi:hypothetical protein